MPMAAAWPNVYGALGDVLSSRSDAGRLPDALDGLRGAISHAPEAALEEARGSLMLPLLALAQSVAIARSDKAERCAEQIRFPLAKADRVAERAIGCLEELLSRTCCSDATEFVRLLYALADLMVLNKETASEEVRLASIGCLANLASRHKCNNADLQDQMAEDRPREVLAFLTHQCLKAAREEGDRGL
ncbi:unnamed protein product [Ostreobium quekettii]|uniref:TTI1 N-terminal TPR domain-containing protein n=1 Tax=Ostreobium quekettii TaxID=121088 RepID=A0A8S1ITY5_9CHLO|nr:unnamed protein product [Ostreobium quekettii]